jgi:hypothetical protein
MQALKSQLQRDPLGPRSSPAQVTTDLRPAQKLGYLLLNQTVTPIESVSTTDSSRYEKRPGGGGARGCRAAAAPLSNPQLSPLKSAFTNPYTAKSHHCHTYECPGGYTPSSSQTDPIGRVSSSRFAGHGARLHDEYLATSNANWGPPVWHARGTSHGSRFTSP